MAARLPLCGLEFYKPPSNDLEKPMTERKTLRSTKEWPLTFAIEKLRGIDSELAEYRRELENGIAEKVEARRGVLVQRYMLHVPVDFREHVAEKAGVKIPTAPSSPAESTGEAEDTPADDGISRLGPPGPVTPTDGVEVDHETGAAQRRVGKGRQ